MAEAAKTRPAPKPALAVAEKPAAAGAAARENPPPAKPPKAAAPDPANAALRRLHPPRVWPD